MDNKKIRYTYPWIARWRNAGFPGSSGSLLRALRAAYCKLFRITDCICQKNTSLQRPFARNTDLKDNCNIGLHQITAVFLEQLEKASQIFTSKFACSTTYTFSYLDQKLRQTPLIVKFHMLDKQFNKVLFVKRSCSNIRLP